MLNDNAVQHNLIVPTGAVREEGTSYHYLAPGEEALPDKELTALLTKCLKKCNYPYTTGKIWTTDAIYRETPDAVKERKEDGCIAVDMEYSALLAVTKYRRVPFIQFFYGADSLDNEEWPPGPDGLRTKQRRKILCVSSRMRFSALPVIIPPFPPL